MKMVESRYPHQVFVSLCLEPSKTRKKAYMQRTIMGTDASELVEQFARKLFCLD